MGVHVKVAGAWQEIGVAAGGVPWAKVSGGTVTTVNNPDGSVDEVHTFTANGTLTVESPGYARVLLVSGGSTAYQNINPGNGGDVRDGIHSLPAGALPVVVGQPGPRGGVTSIGALRTGTAGNSSNGPNSVGAGGKPDDNQVAGFTSDISGTSDDYGRAEQQAPRANRGDGSRNAAESSASAGIVIVRVQKSAPTVSGVAATGGTVTEYTGDGTNGVAGQKYKVHTFTASGDLVVTGSGPADILIAAGGGSTRGPGGGGAGGLIQQRIGLLAGTVPIIVGAVDQNSRVGNMIALAGGAGGNGPGDLGSPGGSGGGAGYQNSLQGGAAGVPGQGFNGGPGDTNYGFGGGGGAGGAGAKGTGGPGLQSNISGTLLYYSAGAPNGTGYDGRANSGHGQKSGVVIVRYEIA